ncbi:MAG: amidohydrolase, partial [Acidimicrobiaceae bacterium]|nr:amidohydrolase [Acidimicrobiaceae bacterium]
MNGPRLLLAGGIVVPMTGARAVFDPGSVLIEGDRIVAVGPAPSVVADDATVVDTTGCAVIP